MNEILHIAIGSLTIGGVIIFLGKKLIDKGFDAALKTFENKLDLLKIEHQIKYSKLHEERASLVKVLYTDLYKLEKALVHMTTSFQGPNWTKDDARRDEAKEQLKICNEFLEVNRIYFSEEFYNELELNIDECRKVINEMERAKRKGKTREEAAHYGQPYPFKDGEAPIDLWLEQEAKVNTEIRTRRIELAQNFRKIIGVVN